MRNHAAYTRIKRRRPDLPESGDEASISLSYAADCTINHFAHAANRVRIDHFSTVLHPSSLVLGPSAMAYLLPCPQCGTKLVVTTGEAGGQVPANAALRSRFLSARPRSLAEVATESVAEAPWSARQSVLFVGAVVAIAGLAFALFMHYRASETYPHVDFPQEIRRMPPASTWTLWSDYLRHGVGKWQPEKGVQQLADIKRYEELKHWEWIGFGVAAPGLFWQLWV